MRTYSPGTYRIGLVINVMNARKCGVKEAFAWLNHQPYDGPFTYSKTQSR